MLLAVVTLSSCNTYIGLGKDLQKLGEGMENTGYGTGWKGDKPSPYRPEEEPQP